MFVIVVVVRLSYQCLVSKIVIRFKSSYSLYVEIEVGIVGSL